MHRKAREDRRAQSYVDFESSAPKRKMLVRMCVRLGGEWCAQAQRKSGKGRAGRGVGVGGEWGGGGGGGGMFAAPFAFFLFLIHGKAQEGRRAQSYVDSDFRPSVNAGVWVGGVRTRG